MLKTLAYAHEAMPMTSILRTCFKKRKLEGEAKEGVDLPEELVPHRVHAKELNSGRMRSWKEKLGATVWRRTGPRNGSDTAAHKLEFRLTNVT